MTGAERNTGNKYQFAWVCACGVEGYSTWSDLKESVAVGGARACKSCAMRENMAQKMLTAAGKEHQTAMTHRAAETAGDRAKWRSPEERRIAKLMSNAKDRCENSRNAAYENYGGRGVKFEFPDVESAARWVVENLGLPNAGLTIDRVDNNRGYEPGNLRWATREEQARNRRIYKNALPNLKIAKALRPDLSDSQVRIMLKRGDSLETIKNWRKYGRK